MGTHCLDDHPGVSDGVANIFGMPTEGRSDWVDLHLLSAVYDGFVDMLVTKDQQILRRGIRLNLGEKVCDVESGIASILSCDSTGIHCELPVVTGASELDLLDPIFDSLRHDYGGYAFDRWWRDKVIGEDRICYAVKEGGDLAAIGVLKDETPAEHGLPPGKTLKICTFKVSAAFGGKRYGELLLKAIYAYAYEGAFENVYLTVFEKHTHLINVLVSSWF